MRPLGVILAVVVGVGSLSGMIWLARYSSFAPKTERQRYRWEDGTYEEQERAFKQQTKKKEQEEKAEKKKMLDDKPPIADKPPFPKVKTGERIFEFGSMGVGEEKSHTFHIDNRGQGTLLIAKGPTTCKCTFSKLAKNSIPPGEGVDVELTWTPKEVTQTFAQHATIWTNDPDLPEFKFKVLGKVVNQYTVSPEGTWYAGHITDIQEGQMSGSLTSSVDGSFKITSIDVSDPKYVTVKTRRMGGHELMRNEVKGGYEVLVRISSKLPVGPYKGHLKLHTTLEGNKTIEVDLRANRGGPILFLPPFGKIRSSWSSERSLLNMGPFRHEAGGKVTLPALVYGLKEPLKIVGVDASENFVKITAEQTEDKAVGDAQRVNLVFEIPPGLPPLTRITPNDIKATIKTNHPKLKELQMEIGFISE